MFGLLFFPYTEQGALSGGHSARGSQRGALSGGQGQSAGRHSAGTFSERQSAGGGTPPPRGHGPKMLPLATGLSGTLKCYLLDRLQSVLNSAARLKIGKYDCYQTGSPLASKLSKLMFTSKCNVITRNCFWSIKHHNIGTYWVQSSATRGVINFQSSSQAQIFLYHRGCKNNRLIFTPLTTAIPLLCFLC